MKTYAFSAGEGGTRWLLSYDLDDSNLALWDHWARTERCQSCLHIVFNKRHMPRWRFTFCKLSSTILVSLLYANVSSREPESSGTSRARSAISSSAKQ